MSISVTFEPGNMDVRIVRVRTTSTFAEVTTAGWYPNTPPNQLNPSDKVEIYYGEGSGSAANAMFDVSISAGVVTLSVAESNIILPVVSGDFAVFSGTSGALADLGYLPSDATKTRVVMLSNTNSTTNYIAQFMDTTGTIGYNTADIVHVGNIVAGNAALAGTFISTAGTLVGGTFIFKHVSNGSSFNATISPSASLGQSTVFTIPNPGAATANFLLSALSGVQHITSGSLQVDAGGLLAGLAAGGTVGTLTLYPTTTANGSLIISPVNAGGAFNTTISNGTMGQSSVMTIPDPANALGRFLVGATATPFVSGEFPVASGTGGLMVSSGLAAANVQNKTNIKAARTADIGGAGAGPISVVVAGMTAASVITASIQTSSNVVSISKVTATATGFDILFSADPGAACTVNYITFIAAQ